MAPKSDRSKKYIELLTSLGLKYNEARIFLALQEADKLTAKAISKTSGVAREIVYQTMPKLEKKGLVEEVIASPKAFKAISMEAAFAMFFEQRKKENKELHAKAKEISIEQPCPNNTQTEENQIEIIPPRREDATWKRELDGFKKSVDFIMPMHKFLQWPQYHAESIIDGAMTRKAKMRIITEKSTKNILAMPSPKFFSPLLAEKLKYISYKFASSLSVEMVIFDKKTMFVSTQKEEQMKDTSWLYSNNQFLVELGNSYFKSLWSTLPDGAKSHFYFRNQHSPVIEF